MLSFFDLIGKYLSTNSGNSSRFTVNPPYASEFFIENSNDKIISSVFKWSIFCLSIQTVIVPFVLKE
ncbi:hypothetical protein DQM68_02710 [Leptospira mayottensis]|uniref:Uncharacterized protein n=2 Tax=Leptospira mayottensis TaxID=1137606 RepID=A0AA87SZX0_9LEPT|nr:hypothetical protein DQM68_02710 [Leptospira mayottensis]AZQ00891.1 hypothetical protein LEP1GSC190_01250 [Leptospira mayottensis 200901116]EKS01432.1 hypothetical protein LEP1GSC125_2663 [Leptospira mayottensis 200901122]AXR63965.1 hypothetical protein DQM28_06755 [Leptospira mayottensis]AXR67333.1 hypothetical protein DPV73_04220 [Leptospira mayottensis]